MFWVMVLVTMWARLQLSRQIIIMPSTVVNLKSAYLSNIVKMMVPAGSEVAEPRVQIRYLMSQMPPTPKMLFVLIKSCPLYGRLTNICRLCVY